MQLSFALKSLGKKKAYINDVSIDIDISANTTVKELLLQIVSQQVKVFNQRKEAPNLLVYLNEKALSDTAETGQVKFNEQYNTTLTDEVKAKETVRMAFEDGLIALFINDEQLEDINQSILLKTNDSITLIRLTFLVGSIW